MIRRRTFKRLPCRRQLAARDLPLSRPNESSIMLVARLYVLRIAYENQNVANHSTQTPCHFLRRRFGLIRAYIHPFTIFSRLISQPRDHKLERLGCSCSACDYCQCRAWCPAMQRASCGRDAPIHHPLFPPRRTMYGRDNKDSTNFACLLVPGIIPSTSAHGPCRRLARGRRRTG